MGGDLVQEVLDVTDRVQHELADVVVLDAVEHGVALLAGGHQPCETHLGQMLRDAGDRAFEQCRQLRDRTLLVEQRARDPQPRGIGQHPQDLDGKRDDILIPLGFLHICVHAQILARVRRIDDRGGIHPGNTRSTPRKDTR